MREREEAWQHIEDLAVQNPLFDKFSSESNNIFGSDSVFLSSPQDDSDNDFNPDNLGGETNEVSLQQIMSVLYYSLHILTLDRIFTMRGSHVVGELRGRLIVSH